MKKILLIMIAASIMVSGINCAKKNEDVKSDQEIALDMAKSAMSASDMIAGTEVDNYNGTVTATFSGSNFSGSGTLKYNSVKGSYKNATNPGDITEVGVNLSFTNFSCAGLTISGTMSGLTKGAYYYSSYYDDVVLSGSPNIVQANYSFTIIKDGKTHTMALNLDYQYGAVVLFTMQVDSYSFSFSDYASKSKAGGNGLIKNLFHINKL